MHDQSGECCGHCCGRWILCWSCVAASVCVFFFSSRRRHTRFDCDWSSDVCSSDLSERDQLLIEAQLARSSAERFARYDTVLARYPGDAYAALLYGDELLNRGALAGVPLDSALVVLRRAAALDSSLRPAYDDLAWVAIRLGRRE